MAAEGRRSTLWVFIGIAVLVAAIGGVYLLVGRSPTDASRTPGQRRADSNERGKNVSALVRDAENVDATYAAPAVQSLGRVADPADAKVRQTLERAIQHKDAEVRAAAAQSIGALAAQQPSQPPPAPLIQAAVSDPDANVRGTAMMALNHSRSPDALDALVEGLYDPDVQVRRYAYEGIQKTIGFRFEPGVYDPETANPNMKNEGAERIAAQVPQFREYLKQKRR